MAQQNEGAGQWLPRARAGSAEDLGRLLEACRGYLLAVARRELDPDLQAKNSASDLVQETFLEAQRDFAQFRGDTEAELLAWLRRLLLNNISNFSRHYRGTQKRQVGDEVALWWVPVPGEGAVERITLWAQVVTGMELDEGDTVRRLDSATWQERRRRLEAVGGPPSAGGE